MTYTTIPEMFVGVTNKYRSNTEHPAYLYKSGDEWLPVSYDYLREQVELMCFGLRALGVGKGDFVGILSENRVEWIISDFAITALGAADVPIFPSMTTQQCAYIYGHCSARAIVVSNRMQLNKILAASESLPHLQHIIVMLEDFTHDDERVITMAEVIKRGADSVPAEQRRELFEEMCGQVKRDDLLTVIYTSGTTGNPKGVMLAHRCLLTNVKDARNVKRLDHTDLLLSYLPLCHSYERMAGFYTAFACEATVAMAPSIDTVAANLVELSPTFLTSVPRFFERVQMRILAAMDREKPFKQKMFHWALETAKEYRKAQRGGSAGPLLKVQFALADKLVLSKIRARTGGRLQYFISGGAALPRELGEFFEAAGLVILEGYGLSEASPVITVNRPASYEFGSVGRPMDSVEVKLADDGEILARGENVMLGYLNDEEATREAIDEEGWLHTGDIGAFNENGNLVITDRKKNIFVSSGGKNIAPQPIENAVSQSRFVDQVMLIGEKRDFCTALIVPNYELLQKTAAEKGIKVSGVAELVVNKDIIAEVKRDLDKLLHGFSKYEKVRRFKLLERAFSEEDGEITPTLKIKRRIVEQRFANDIEELYSNN